MPPNPEILYRQLGLLLSQKPELATVGDFSHDQLQWLARASALVEQDGNIHDVTAMRTSMALVNTGARQHHLKNIMVTLYRVLARAELASPAEAQGAFINVGETFTAYQAVAKVLAAATQSVLLVDPYLSVDALFDFAPSAAEGVVVKLLVDSQQQGLIDGLRPGVVRWQQQYGEARQLEARRSQPRQLHDRLIIIDSREAWTLTQSFKDLVARAPASLLRAEDQVAIAKLAAYEEIWAQAQPL